MNNTRRREIVRAGKMLLEVKEIIESVIDQEQDAFDNLPESIQLSDKGDKMSDNIYTLSDVIEYCDEAIDLLESI